jgi:hypothetical protein
MKSINIRQIMNMIALVVVVIINGLATGLPLNGQDTGEISDRFDVFFVPAGYVFSIWGLIYLALIGFAIYQFLPSQRDNADVARIGYWFVASSVANSAWIFLWHYNYFGASVVVMLALLVTLIVIYTRLDINRRATSTADKWLIHFPFRIYLGWISVATIANITSYLDFVNWGRWGLAEETWFVIMMGVAVVLALAMTIARRDAAYLLVLVWAFAGIAIKFSTITLIATVSWVATALVAGMVVWSWWTGRKTIMSG